MRKKCILLRTKDKRQFFTHSKNCNKIMEFANTFNAEVSIVKAENPEILDLIPLAAALANQEYSDKKDYEVLERIL